ncbi:PPE family protein [Mycobacterium sp.]|uniref:PPE family protein n=1 Tax=Mycobacterium sp. TaxID=1785 RepID=UPI003C46CE93
MDFGALPPEINSARIYSGPGSGPMLTAADAWDTLASELNSSAAAYRSVIANLTVDGWQGPSSIMMANSVAPYVAWMHSTAAEAEQSANQARTAASAYQSAFAGMVPVPLIEANRAQLASLVASNFFGQNSPAIAATETAYEEMWAQDAQSMYGYAASSAAAARLTPFNRPPSTTNPSGLGAQAAAVTQAAGTPASHAQAVTSSQTVSLLPSALQQLATPSATADPLGFTPADIFGDAVDAGSASASGISSSFSGSSIATTNHAIAINAERDDFQGVGPFVAASSGSLSPAGPANLGGPSASAAMGRASLVGTLSVPQTWAATATPAVDPAALAVPSVGTAPLASAGMPAGIFGESLLGTLAGRGVSNVAAKLRTPSVIPRSPAAG